MKTLKSWLQKLLLILAGVLAGLLIVEGFAVATGVAIPKTLVFMHDFYHGFLEPDAQLGFKAKPNNLQSMHNFWEEGGGVNVAINTDKYGFRNRNKDYTESDIYFFGDSFTWGLFLEQEKTFPSLVEAELEQSVINLGIPGYGLEQYEILFRNWVTKYKPKIAILSLYSNDFKNLISSEELKNFYDLSGVNQYKYESLAWYNKTFSHQLIDFYKETINKSNNESDGKRSEKGFFFYNPERLGLESYYIGGIGVSRDYLTSTAKMQVESAILRLIEIANSTNTKLFIFLIPTKESANIKEYIKLFPSGVDYLDIEHNAYQQLCQLAKSKNTVCVDLTEAFRHHSEDEKLYFDIDSHWNVAGHKLAAQLILDTLVKEESLLADKNLSLLVNH